MDELDIICWCILGELTNLLEKPCFAFSSTMAANRPFMTEMASFPLTISLQMILVTIFCLPAQTLQVFVHTINIFWMNLSKKWKIWRHVSFISYGCLIYRDILKVNNRFILGLSTFICSDKHVLKIFWYFGKVPIFDLISWPNKYFMIITRL